MNDHFEIDTHFRDVLDQATEPKAKAFAAILKNHGEAQIHMASGDIHSLHLGDKGGFIEEGVIYKNRERGVFMLFWSQVEALDFHKGYRES
jgi:uncharacterized protein YukJ